MEEKRRKEEKRRRKVQIHVPKDGSPHMIFLCVISFLFLLLFSVFPFLLKACLPFCYSLPGSFFVSFLYFFFFNSFLALFTRLPVCLIPTQPVCLLVSSAISQPPYMSACLFLQPICLPFCLPGFLFPCLSRARLLLLSVCLSYRLSTCLSI